ARRQSIRRDAAGVDRVHADAVLDTAIGEYLGDIEQRGVDRAADGELGRAGPTPDADDVDDRTVRRLQMWPGGTRQAHRAEEFQREAVGPIAVGERQEIATLRRTRVVDPHVAPAQP